MLSTVIARNSKKWLGNNKSLLCNRTNWYLLSFLFSFYVTNWLIQFDRLSKLTVNGNGYFRTNELYVHADDVEIDLAGDMHADFSGFNDQGSIENGTGLAKETYHQGMTS